VSSLSAQKTDPFFPTVLSSHTTIDMSDKLDAPSSADTGSIAKDGGNGPKAIIKNVDMSDEMQQESVDIASAALEKYNIEKDIAAQIKKEFDRRHGPTWHVVVGKNFGSYVTHGKRSLHTVSHISARLLHRLTFLMLCFSETKHFIYFYVGSLAILIWKS
jgi:dynein light chain LC8-type